MPSLVRRLVLLLGLLAALSPGLAQLGLQPYQRPDLGFVIGHPSTWQVTENAGDGDYFFTLAPTPGSAGSGEVAVEILLSSDVPASLDGLVAETMQELQANFPGLREVQRFDIVMSGLPAKLVVVQGTDQNQNQVTWQLAFALNGGRGYLVILETLTASVTTHQQLLDQMLASFAFTPQGGQTPPPLGGQTPPLGGQTPPPLGGQTPPPLGGQTPPPAGGQPQPSGEYGQIAIGQPVSGAMTAATQDQIVYHTYVVDVPQGTTSLTIAVQGNGADLDLAVKIGAPITDYNAVDHLDTTEQPNPTYTIANPPAGPIYIDVLNLVAQPASYTLMVTSGTGGGGGAAPGGNPLAPAQSDPFVGVFSGANLSLELTGAGGRYSGQLRFGDQVFPVQAQSAGNGLDGTFTSGGGTFAFTATFDGSTLLFVTDGQAYPLQKRP